MKLIKEERVHDKKVILDEIREYKKAFLSRYGETKKSKLVPRAEAVLKELKSRS